MFNWTTTRIINSLKDLTTGLDLVTVNNGKMHVKRSMTFDANYISSVYVAPAKDPTMFELNIDFASLMSNVFSGMLTGPNAVPEIVATLNFYIGLEGSEQSVFANDWYRKGRPFSVGFTVNSSSSATSIVNEIIANVTKYNLNTLDGKLFEVSLSSSSNTTLVIKGLDEHQRIMNASISYDSGLYVTTISHYEDGATSNPAEYTLVHRGSNGFGTYYQLTKDLRLPTAQHTKAYKTLEDELPIPGAKYTQFIVTYCAPSMANPAFTVIGQKENSETTHIFWVKSEDACDSNLATDFLNYFIGTGTDGLNLGNKVKQAGVAPNGFASEVNLSTNPTSYTTPDPENLNQQVTYRAGTDTQLFTDDDTQS